MKKSFWLLLAFMVPLLFVSCQDTEEDYDYTYVMVGETTGFNPFSTGDVRLCVDDDFNLYNRGEDHVEMSFVKDFVYKIQMINRIPEEGWKDSVPAEIQHGYVGRLLLDDGSYSYCRFYAYTIDYDANANQFVLYKYQSAFNPK